MATLGERLKHAREHSGLTLQALSSQIGASAANLSRIERNEISPSVDIVLRICKTLNLSYDWVLAGKGEMCPPAAADEQADSIAPMTRRDSLSAEEEIILEYFHVLPKGAKKDLIKAAVLAISQRGDS